MTSLTGVASDHLPVIATIEPTQQREPTKQEARIDLTLYTDPEARRDVKDIWEATYSTLPPQVHGHHTVWHEAKSRVAEYLLGRTSERRQSKANKVALAEFAIDLHLKATGEGPSPTYLRTLADLRRREEEEARERKRSTWWAYISTLRSERSSKNMFNSCLLYTSPSPRDQRGSRMPSSA